MEQTQIKIENKNGILTYFLPQGMTGEQFAAFKRDNASLITEAKKNTDGAMVINVPNPN